MNMKKRVIRLERDGPADTGMPEMQCDPADFQSALPTQNLHTYYSDPEIGLNVGVWDTTTMQEAFGPYPGDEFIWVLQGAFKMIDGDGKAVKINEGQSVCFRNAIPISWKQEGYLKNSTSLILIRPHNSRRSRVPRTACDCWNPMLA